MDTVEIIKDALKYPLSDWKKILILGVIIIITSIINIPMLLGINNNDIIVLLAGIGFLIGFLVNGYSFRIIKSSLDGNRKPPEFSNWINMGIEGAKVYMVYIIYLIPVILLISYLVLSSYENLALNLNEVGLNLFTYLISLLNSVIWEGIFNFIMVLISLFTIIIFGTSANIIGILYIILVTPIILVAIANMAYYEGEFKSAFRLGEIIEEISLIGWSNLIK